MNTDRLEAGLTGLSLKSALLSVYKLKITRTSCFYLPVEVLNAEVAVVIEAV